MDLDVDSDYDGDIDNDDDALEESPGGLVRVRDDTNPGLTPMKLTLTSGASGTVWLRLTSGLGKVRVWENSTMTKLWDSTQPVRLGTLGVPKVFYLEGLVASLPEKLYVEGIKPSDTVRDIQLRLCYTNKTFSCRDEIRLTAIQIESVELVGAPLDGLVTMKGSTVTMKVHLLPTSYVPPSEEPKWYYCQLVSDGSWEDWTSFGVSASGKTYTRATTLSGIFRVKAILSIGGSFLCEGVYRRATDEEYGPGVIGDPDAFGVVDTQMQISIRNAAKAFLGSTDYPYAGAVPAQYGFPEYPNPSFKCNIFVAHRAVEAGAVVPAINGTPATYPPLANEWAGAEDTHPIIPWFQSDIGDWILYASPMYPQPGIIVAHPSPSLASSGHVGIVDYDGNGIAAGVSGTVNKYSTSFLDGTSGFRKYEP